MHATFALLALVAGAQAIKPVLLNADYSSVKPDVPFTLKWNEGACDSGCTLKVKAPPSGNLQDVTTLTTGVTGTSTFTPAANWPPMIAFEIQNAEDVNYSEMIPYAGTGTVPSSSSAVPTSSAMVPSTSSVDTETSSSTTQSVATSSVPVLTTVGPLTTSESTTASIRTASRNTTTSMSRPTTEPSVVPTSDTGRVSASLVLVAGVAAAMAYLS